MTQLYNPQSPDESKRRTEVLSDFIAGRLKRESGQIGVESWLLFDQVDVGVADLPAIRLFEKHPHSGSLVPFRQPGTPISALSLSQRDWVYFSEEDLPSIRTYIETLFLTRSTLFKEIPIERQSKLIREAAIQVVDDIFIDPSPENLKRGTKIVSSMVYALMKEPQAYSLMSALSSHDPYTLQHSVGTAIQAIILAKRMGLTSVAELEEAGAAGLFHDIGKIKVRREVINKQGPLSELEWMEMRTHSKEGYALVAKNPDLSPAIKSAILEHHEDRHGTGYPNQKKSTELPLLTRIVTVADIFNALTTDRSYSKALPVYDALQLMKNQMAHKLDPAIFKELILLHSADALL